MQTTSSSSSSLLSSSFSNSSSSNSSDVVQPSRTNSNSSAQEKIFNIAAGAATAATATTAATAATVTTVTTATTTNRFHRNPSIEQNPWNASTLHNVASLLLMEQINGDITSSFINNGNRETYGRDNAANLLYQGPNGCRNITFDANYYMTTSLPQRYGNQSNILPFNTSLNLGFMNNQYHHTDGIQITIPHSNFNDANQTLNAMMRSPRTFTIPEVTAPNTTNNNMMNESILQMLKSTDKLPRNSQYNFGRCNACGNNISLLRCLQCNINTCYECALIHSKHLHHRVIPVPLPIGTANKNRDHHYCGQHNELLLFVCARCNKVICNTCKIQDHNDHECAQISDYRIGSDMKLKSSIEINNDGIQLVRNAIDRTVQYMSIKKQAVADVKNDIHNCFNQIIRCLQDRERYLIETLTGACDRDLQILDSQKAGLQNILSGLSDTNNTFRTINANGEQMDDIEFSLKLTTCHRQLEEHIIGYQSLQPKHSTYIFVAPDGDVLRTLRELGLLISDNKFVVRGFIGNAIKAVYLQYPFLCEVPFNWNTYSTLEPICAASSTNSGNSVKPPSYGCPLLSFAEEGHRDGQVSRPWGICVDRFGNILISDRRNNRVQIFDAHGNLKLKFGRQGDGDGEFDLPAGICVDIDDRIIVVDKDNHRVQIFDQNGHFLQKFGTRGNEYGQFQYPWDVAVNSRRQIVVTDSRNHRIQQFNSKGGFIRHILFNDYAPNKNPASPRGVCYTPTGNIIVSDFDNHCLYLINPEEDKNVKVVGCEGCGPRLQFNRPSGILCDNAGNIVLADSKNQRILVFNTQFKYMWQLDIRPSRNNLMPTYIDEKDRTCDVALMPDGRIVILIELSPDSKEGCNPRKKFVHVL